MKARFHHDKFGTAMESHFSNLSFIFVPIFDGINAMSSSCKDWFNKNFDNLCTGIGGDVAVRVKCALWWHYYEDTVNSDSNGDLKSYQERTFRPSFQFSNSSMNVLDFFFMPIIKSKNHRKHNSHHWFFQGVCEALGTHARFAFLTDCGTTYTTECLAKLTYELLGSNDLIGVTARQRVEVPNDYFHPCEDTGIPFFKGNHADSGNPRPCWKCYAAYMMSPAPLQGFEFEERLIVSSSLFNLVEAMPVLPGPCQLLDWHKMKEYNIVSEYFNILMNEENTGCIDLSALPNGCKAQNYEGYRKLFSTIKVNPRGICFILLIYML